MESFFNRVLTYVHYRWNQRIRLAPENHAQLLELLALLSPCRARGLRKIRVGASRDGGCVMLDDFQKIDAALSLGIGPDVSWDYALAERGIPVWQYDHTVSAPPGYHTLFHFEQKRIVQQSSSPSDLAFTALLQQQSGRQFILKMDIEGDEWEILAHLEPVLLGTCRQLVIEFHNFSSIGNQVWRDSARQALLRMADDFAVVHVHGNNLSRHILSRDLELPDWLEVSFAHRNYYQFETTQETFPGPHDKKNNPYFPDFNLGHFQFRPDGEKI